MLECCFMRERARRSRSLSNFNLGRSLLSHPTASNYTIILKQTTSCTDIRCTIKFNALQTFPTQDNMQWRLTYGRCEKCKILVWSRPRVRTRMSVSCAHAHAGLACARALLARLFCLVQVNENDVSASTYLHCSGSFLTF